MTGCYPDCTAPLNRVVPFNFSQLYWLAVYLPNMLSAEMLGRPEVGGQLGDQVGGQVGGARWSSDR